MKISDIRLKPSNLGDEGSVVALGLSYLFFAASALAIFYLIYSAILYITSAGNADNAKKGMQGIINAVIGIIICTLAFAIIRIVVNTTTGGFGS